MVWRLRLAGPTLGHGCWRRGGLRSFLYLPGSTLDAEIPNVKVQPVSNQFTYGVFTRLQRFGRMKLENSGGDLLPLNRNRLALLARLPHAPARLHFFEHARLLARLHRQQHAARSPA